MMIRINEIKPALSQQWRGRQMLNFEFCNVIFEFDGRIINKIGAFKLRAKETRNHGVTVSRYQGILKVVRIMINEIKSALSQQWRGRQMLNFEFCNVIFDLMDKQQNTTPESS